jgi:hypothetical protein
MLAQRNTKMGPFTEHVEIDGKIVRIGGTDDTAHALIKLPEGDVISAECSRELAVQLARHLYGASVRVVGSARWERCDTGEWNLISVRAKEFHLLCGEDLATSVARLRKVDTDWKGDEDPIQYLQRLRDGGCLGSRDSDALYDVSVSRPNDSGSASNALPGHKGRRNCRSEAADMCACLCPGCPLTSKCAGAPSDLLIGIVESRSI